MDNNSEQNAADELLKRVSGTADAVTATATAVKAELEIAQQARKVVEEAAASTGSLLSKTQGDAAAVEQTRSNAERQQEQFAALLAKSSSDADACSKQALDARSVGEELRNLINQTKERSGAASDACTQATASLQTLNTLASKVNESSARVEGLKTKVEQDAEVAAQRSAHIEQGRKYVDEKRAEIDVILNTARQLAGSVDAQSQQGRKLVEDLTSLLSAAQGTKSSVDSIAEAVRTIREQCDGHANATKNLAMIAQDVEARVKAYEGRLNDLEMTAAARLKTIESLLPGAAAAGLASAFGKRRENFKRPMRYWQWVFVGSVLALIGVAWLEFGLVTKPDATLSWDRLALLIMHRLPFMLPLIWLAFYASTKAALAQRVEEDYAFKETVSRSFEGYRKEMMDLEGKAQPLSPLDRLCNGVLGVVTSPPGRIYERHPLVPTPANLRMEPSKEQQHKELGK